MTATINGKPITDLRTPQLLQWQRHPRNLNPVPAVRDPDGAATRAAVVAELARRIAEGEPERTTEEIEAARLAFKARMEAALAGQPHRP